MFKIRDRDNVLAKYDKSYIMGFLEKVDERVMVDDLVEAVVIKELDGARGCYSPRYNVVFLNPRARSFKRNYVGYKYKTFGGVADLTPGGVLCHELGHALGFTKRPDVVPAFRVLRRSVPKSITSYGSWNLQEDVAESFRLYCTNPAMLESVAKDRFEILNRFAADFIKHR